MVQPLDAAWPLGTQAQDWEQLWAPYDPATYAAALAFIAPDDFVLDIGAGDLRFSRQVSLIARRVEAIEIQAWLWEKANQSPLPPNLFFHLGDAREMPFPSGITTAILLMRHCTCYAEYVAKLRQAGCRRLITNARWRMGVELVRLDQPRKRYSECDTGWYGCECGSVGFKPGPAAEITTAIDAIIHEVNECPKCESIPKNIHS